MVTVIGLADQQLDSLCDAAAAAAAASASATATAATASAAATVASVAPTPRTTSEEPHIRIANHLFPKGRVLSGDAGLIKWVVAHAREHGAAMAKELSVAGAFHSPYMAPAKDRSGFALSVKPRASLPLARSAPTNMQSHPVCLLPLQARFYATARNDPDVPNEC